MGNAGMFVRCLTQPAHMWVLWHVRYIYANRRNLPIPPLSTLTSRATHAHPTSPRSTGFCAIWDCISSSSSSARSWQLADKKKYRKNR